MFHPGIVLLVPVLLCLTIIVPLTAAEALFHGAAHAAQAAAAQAAANDETQLVFPHVADGGGYRTVLLLTNGSNMATTATISFYSDLGTPLSVGIGDNLASAFHVAIPPKGSGKIETTGSGTSVLTGWARVTTSPSVGLNGNAVFQLFRDQSLFSEASVQPAAPATRAEFYADEENGFSTGFAMANPGTVPAAGTLTIRSRAGEVAGVYPVSLEAGHHRATFLFQLLSGAPSGRAEIQLTQGSLSITALRYNRTSVFSSVSVGQPGGTITSAFFSPGGGVRARIVAEINKASSTIDAAIYSFTADEIRGALIAAKTRGIAIRIIADSSQAGSQGSEIATLESLGFNLKRSAGGSGGIMHNKYMIIDGRLLFTGSYNWSVSAEDFNYENGLFISGLPVIQSYVDDFNRIWNR